MKKGTFLMNGYCLGTMGCQSSTELCSISLSKNDLTFSSLAQSWGEFIFKNLKTALEPVLIAPMYNKSEESGEAKFTYRPFTLEGNFAFNV